MPLLKSPHLIVLMHHMISTH